MLINIAQGVSLTDEQFAEEIAQRRKNLELSEGEYVVGCPGCAFGESETSAAGQDQQ